MQDVRICPRCRRINPAQAGVCTDCGRDLSHAALTDVPDAEITRTVPPPEPNALACPECGAAMQAGESHFRYSWLLWNWNVLTMKLSFNLLGRREEAIVMRPGDKRRSARCPRCGGVWISRWKW